MLVKNEFRAEKHSCKRLQQLMFYYYNFLISTLYLTVLIEYFKIFPHEIHDFLSSKLVLLVRNIPVFCAVHCQRIVNTASRAPVLVVSCSCIKLTSALGNQNGVMWKPLQLISAIHLIFHSQFFRCLDAGADGMVFTLQPNSITQMGNGGGGIGCTRIPNSLLVVELDTYQNGWGSGVIMLQ